MKNIAKLKANKIDNLIVCRAEEKPTDFGPEWIDVPQDVGIGWIRQPDGTFIPPATAVPPVADIGTLRSDGLIQRDRIFNSKLELVLGQPLRNGSITFSLLGQCLIALHEEKAKTTDFFTNQAATTGEDPAVLLTKAVTFSKNVFGYLGAAWGYYRGVTTQINTAMDSAGIETALRDFGNSLSMIASAQVAVTLPGRVPAPAPPPR